MTNLKKSIVLFSIAVSSTFATAQAQSNVKCEKTTNSFEQWREDFRQEAIRNGISTSTWNAALPFMTVDPDVLRRDRAQSNFYLNFLDWVPRAHTRLQRARVALAQNKRLFDRIQARFGVPGEILVAFWGMETDFARGPIAGAKYSIIKSMTTLAYDCRRPALFRENLLSALKLVEAKDVSIDELVGQWAGEMSGMQLTPSNFFKFGVDFDGDGRRDIVRSLDDLMASAGNMFKSYGWIGNQPYLIEVKVPANMPWQDADLTVQRMFPAAKWKSNGVTLSNGSPLPANLPNSSLMLPMGRLGPAFLAFANFKAMLLWNASLNNALTAGYLAYRTADPSAPAMRTGNGTPEVLTADELREFQTIFKKRGYQIDKIDGYLGTQTRAATRDMQMKLGMPADAYPTKELLNKLRQ